MARARLALRLQVETHKRSISAQRRALGEAKGALRQLEEAGREAGISLLIDNDNAEPKEAERNE